MQLKNLLILTLTPSIAVGGSFDGAYVGANVGGAYSSTKSSGFPNFDNGSSLNGTYSQGSFLGQITAGYSKEIEGFNLAGNVFYNVGNQNAGTSSNTGRINGTLVNISGQGVIKNSWGISIEPGYNINDQTMGYLKFTYNNGTLYGNLNCPTGCSTTSASSNSNLNGWGYGLGTKYLLTDSIFVTIEATHTQYNSWNDGGVSYKPNQTMGFAGLGYKF